MLWNGCAAVVVEFPRPPVEQTRFWLGGAHGVAGASEDVQHAMVRAPVHEFEAIEQVLRIGSSELVRIGDTESLIITGDARPNSWQVLQRLVARALLAPQSRGGHDSWKCGLWMSPSTEPCGVRTAAVTIPSPTSVAGVVLGGSARDGVTDRLGNVVDAPVHQGTLRGICVGQQSEFVAGDGVPNVER